MMKEGGLIHKWKSKWWPRQSFCSRGVITESKPVTVFDMQGAYYLLGMSVAIAIVALLGETTVKNMLPQSCKTLLPASHPVQNGPHQPPNINHTGEMWCKPAPAYHAGRIASAPANGGANGGRMAADGHDSEKDEGGNSTGDNVTAQENNFQTEFTTDADYSSITARDHAPKEEIPMKTPTEETFGSGFTYNN